MKLTSNAARVNLLLPAELLEELRRYVPPRRRSDFVAQAVERELRRLRLRTAVEASAGAWQEADHPELADGPSIDRWLATTRGDLDWAREPEA